jgi:hypothetical protein
MDEEQENVKKIRELDSFETSQPLATGDYLIVATNEGIPATKKSTIKEVVDIYNIAMAEDDEEDQVDDPDNPGEKIKDPEKEPGLEKDTDGDGEPDEKIITTPVNAGNLDTILQSGGGLEVITECRTKEDNAIVSCDSANVYYKYNKLQLEDLSKSYKHNTLTRIHYLEKTSNGVVDPPVMRSAVFPKSAIHFDQFGRVASVHSYVGNLLEIAHHSSVLTSNGLALMHLFKLDKVSCPNEQYAFDFHSFFYTFPTEDLTKPLDNNWVAFLPQSAGGTTEDFSGILFLLPEPGLSGMWFYYKTWDSGDSDGSNGWCFTSRTQFPWVYVESHGWVMFDVKNPGTSNVYWSQHIYSTKHEKWVNYKELTEENPEASSNDPAPSTDLPGGSNPTR